jgi:hypothetical protein
VILEQGVGEESWFDGGPGVDTGVVVVEHVEWSGWCGVVCEKVVNDAARDLTGQRDWSSMGHWPTCSPLTAFFWSESVRLALLRPGMNWSLERASLVYFCHAKEHRG